VSTKKQFMRDVMAIEYKWLIDIAPHYYEYKITKLDVDKKNLDLNIE
jgi:hypothetical protein